MRRRGTQNAHAVSYFLPIWGDLSGVSYSVRPASIVWGEAAQETARELSEAEGLAKSGLRTNLAVRPRWRPPRVP